MYFKYLTQKLSTKQTQIGLNLKNKDHMIKAKMQSSMMYFSFDVQAEFQILN